MELHLTQDGGVSVAAVTGKLTFEAADDFQSLLMAFSESGNKRLIIDLSKVDMIDSAGLGMLTVAQRASESGGWEFLVRRPQGPVKHLLEVAEFDKFVNIEL